MITLIAFFLALILWLVGASKAMDIWREEIPEDTFEGALYAAICCLVVWPLILFMTWKDRDNRS